MQHEKQPDSRVMLREINEIPLRVKTQLAEHGEAYREFGASLIRRPPKFVTTCARGSSDCAAMYLKYLVETRLGIPVASIGPSVASLYRSRLHAEDVISFAISQSGGSADIAKLHEALQSGGARGLALINAENSRLGEISQHTLHIGAGAELALPATKSFICSLVAIASILAAWTNDLALASALEELPEILANSLIIDTENLLNPLLTKQSTFVFGRGPSLAIANEAALKLKETVFIHAEAFSAAEVLHGPAALVADGFVCVAFASNDLARNEVFETAQKLDRMGAKIILMDAKNARLTHPLLEPLVQITRFYVLVEALAQSRGTNPDRSRNLQKVTSTL